MNRKQFFAALLGASAAAKTPEKEPSKDRSLFITVNASRADDKRIVDAISRELRLSSFRGF